MTDRFQFGTGSWQTMKAVDGHEDDILGAIDPSRVWQSPLDFLRTIPSGILPGGNDYDDNFGRGLHAAQVIDETVRMGIVDRTYEGMQVIESYTIPRRQAIILSNPPMVIFGIGLERGVPYTVTGSERCYLLHTIDNARSYDVLDAVTGRILRVRPEQLIEMTRCEHCGIGVSDAAEHAVAADSSGWSCGRA